MNATGANTAASQPGSGQGYPPGYEQQYYDEYYRQYYEQSQSQTPGGQTPRKPQPSKNPRRNGSRRRKKGLGRWIGLAVFITIILIVLANWSTVMSLTESLMGGNVNYREYPEELEYTITRTVTFDSSYGYGFNISIPVPNDIYTLSSEGQPAKYLQRIHSSEQRSTVGIEFGAREERDIWSGESTSNQTWWEWELPNGNTGRYVVAKEHRITSRTVYWRLDATKTGTVIDMSTSSDPKVINLLNKYLGEEWKITPDHPMIQDVARQLREGTGGNVYLIMRNIYTWMRSEFTYETDVQMDPKWAYETLADKRGDCDDQSVLFVSLLRASGIPAWLELGGLYDRGARTPSWGGHAWMKVWVPMLDAQGSFDPSISGTVDIDIVNDQFLFRDCYRYAEWESDGNGDHLMEYYMFIRYFGSPSIEIDWASSIISETGSVRYITADGEVASTPGFGGMETLAALGAISIVMVARGRKKKKEAEEH
ncbi:MAG: transglutaminase-like domain-containing protein [Candidatus Thermoplasmatota archaeon]|nr:transglutaminase-like domain-containing protein [Candidatus Thermoplasmatota archaeon]